MDLKIVVIGIALLGIIAGTWACFHSINRRLDRLLHLATKSGKQEYSKTIRHLPPGFIQLCELSGFTLNKEKDVDELSRGRIKR